MCFPAKLRTSFEVQNTSHPRCIRLPSLVQSLVLDERARPSPTLVASALGWRASDYLRLPCHEQCSPYSSGSASCVRLADSAIASVRPVPTCTVPVPSQERKRDFGVHGLPLAWRWVSPHLSHGRPCLSLMRGSCCVDSITCFVSLSTRFWYRPADLSRGTPRCPARSCRCTRTCVRPARS